VFVEPKRLGATLDSVVLSAGLGLEPVGNRWSLRPPWLALGLGDILVLLVVYLVTALRLESYTFDLRLVDPSRPLLWCGVLAAIWVPVAINNHAYHRSVIVHSLRSPYVIAKSTVMAGALFHVVPLVGGPVYSRTASMTVVLALMLAMVVWRWLVSVLIPFNARSSTEVVVVGAGWAGSTLAEALANQPRARVRIVAFVDSDPQLVGSTLRGIPIAPISRLPELIRLLKDGPRIVLAMPEEAHASVYEQLTALAQAGVEVVTMASLYEQVTGRIPVRHLGSFWWAMLPKPSSDIVYLGIKRLIDVSLAVLGLLLLVLLLPLVAVPLKRETAGSLFFSQVRIGRYGKPLKLFKLRSLRPNPATFVDYWERKRANVPSAIGALLRATGIDELPQCWNVLRGEMTFVGPRPYVPEEVADFQREIPFFRCRALVKPGITGWAQVNWGYGLSLEDEIEKLQYDLFYVGHQSFYLDLLIMLRTLALALRRSRPEPAIAAAANTPSPPTAGGL
jgi:lipopolysaccharide/colanic/teichoic acid biosynthesis glycosyltransferase